MTRVPTEATTIDSAESRDIRVGSVGGSWAGASAVTVGMPAPSLHVCLPSAKHRRWGKRGIRLGVSRTGRLGHHLDLGAEAVAGGQRQLVAAPELAGVE